MTDQTQDRALRAVIAMVLTNLTLASADAIIKVTVADIPLAQFIFLRSCITLPMLALLLWWGGSTAGLRPQRPGWALLRSALLLASLMLYYAALPRIDFSLAAAAYYTIPLFVTLLSGLLTAERVTKVGWIGVALGFAGVILMLKPQAGQLNLSALMPLGSALLYAVAMVVTRTRSRDENPFVLALVFNAAALLSCGAVGWAGLSQDWQGWAEIPWALIGFLSLTMLVGSVGTAMAYQLGPPALISTWDFSYLAFAVLIGVTVFSERLDLLSCIGIGLIPVAGLIVLRGHGRAGRILRTRRPLLR